MELADFTWAWTTVHRHERKFDNPHFDFKLLLMGNNMSFGNTSNTINQLPVAMTPEPAAVVATIENADIKSEVEDTKNADIKSEVEATTTSAAPALKSGSVIVLSDDDIPEYSPRMTVASTETTTLAQEKAVAAKTADFEADGQHSSKRPASTEAEGASPKKLKTNEEGNTTGEGEKAPSETNKLEAIVEVKIKANTIIKKKNAQISELRDKLAEVEKERDALEESRYQFEADKIVFKEQQAIRNADKIAEARREREWQSNAAARMKAAAVADYERKLSTKISFVERQLKAKHVTMENTLNQKLENKTEKLEETLKKFSEAKEQWRKEIQELKAQVKEQAKHGGAKAQQVVKELKEEVKIKDTKISELTSDKQRLHGEIINLKAHVNAEKTQLADLHATHNSTCAEIKALFTESQAWKTRATLRDQDFSLMQAKLKQELKTRQSLHYNAMHEIEEKWRLQAQNSAQSQQRVVTNQRAVFHLNGMLDTKSKHIEELQAKLVECQKSLRVFTGAAAAAAVERRSEDEGGELGGDCRV